MNDESKFKSGSQQAFLQAQGLWNQIQNEALNQALSDYGKLIQDSISQKNGVFTNQSMDVQQGFAAEAHHVGSFNIEAAAKGQNNHRATRDVGVHNDPVADIHINTPQGTTKHQVKFYKDGEKTSAALSPEKYDNVGKIVPKDQVEAVKTSAQNKANRNKETRPDTSKSYQDTADNATDKLTSSDGKVSSTGLNRRGEGSSEELVQEAKTKKNGPEYKEKDRVRREFNAMQYRNAAKSGAIGGAVSEGASILLEALRSDKPLTIDECMKAAERIVQSSLKGAGNALLVTSIQHAGQAMIDAASKQSATHISQTIGKQLVKGNVAATVAQITVQLGQNIYAFSTGKIDNLEFASSTIGGGMQIVGSSLASSAGTGVATYLGAYIPAAVSGYAIGGSTLGALGVMASGTVFAIGFAIAAGAYVNHFSSTGNTIAHKDLKSALELLNGGKIDLSTYVGQIGKMSELTFKWTDILPLSGSISVISEYKVRKNQLRHIQDNIINQLELVEEQESHILEELSCQYHEAIKGVDQQYQEVYASITVQSLKQFDNISNELNQYLEMRYSIFTSMRKSYDEHYEMMNLEQRKQLEYQHRSQAFKDELSVIQQNIEDSDISNSDIKHHLQTTILSRMDILIPQTTGWDQACSFLELNKR